MAQTSRALNESDIFLFQEGTHSKLADVLGAHHFADRGGTQMGVWAPNAKSVSVIGDFNNWQPTQHYLERTDAGLWKGFISNLYPGSRYKYHIEAATGDYSVDKADPFAFLNETPPQNASVVWDLNYQWNDDAWMAGRRAVNSLTGPMSIYEVHLGSWRRKPDGRFLSYRELADQLIGYVTEMGFTHVEFLPIMEHPFYGSWGYQTTGFFAPTSRYGSPQDFMYLVDRFHQSGIGVILDWVPSHFPNDEFSLGFFDGLHEYEPADPRRGIHPDWNSYIFDYGRKEVRSFLLSSALFWLDKYHVDGLRVDAVASMLYLDYSRRPGEWIPNENGGRENNDAIAFLRSLNEGVYRDHPDVQTTAEESTAWPSVSRPTSAGGLGFGFKWDMGWMHDTLHYMSLDPAYRRFHQGELTFRMVYAFNENFVLPLSHDEVVYGKGSLLNKMPGDNWRKFANLRLLFAYMFSQPGKKLIFMGGEFGQRTEWRHDGSLDWALLNFESHAGLRLLVGDLNRLYRSEPALNHGDHNPDNFEWIDFHDEELNVLSYLRKGGSADQMIAVVLNFSPVPRTGYRIGVPRKGQWREIFNSDSQSYGGTGRGNWGGVSSSPFALHGRNNSIAIDLPPLGAVFLSWENESTAGTTS